MARSRKPNGPAKTSKPPEVPARGAPTLELLARAQKGDETCVNEFKALLDDPERGPVAVEFFGNLAARTREFAVDMVARTNLAIKAATPRKMAKLRAELEGPDPTAIERLLAERAVFCWLILWEYESALALRNGEMTLKQSEFHQRRIDATHRRFLSSVRTLATVRKLALPAVQINLGGNQVNVAGP